MALLACGNDEQGKYVLHRPGEGGSGGAKSSDGGSRDAAASSSSNGSGGTESTEPRNGGAGGNESQDAGTRQNQNESTQKNQDAGSSSKATSDAGEACDRRTCAGLPNWCDSWCCPGYKLTGSGCCGDCVAIETTSCGTDNGGCGNPLLVTCTVDADGDAVCHDVDECATDNGGCGSPTYYTCTNNFGAPPTCANIDECAVDNGGCDQDPMATCTDNLSVAPGCTCPPFYTGNGIGPNGCADLDECGTDNGDCGPAAAYACTNNVGAAPTCTEIGACATDNGGCGDPAFYTCTYDVDGDPVCDDIDECKTNNGGCGDERYYACTDNDGAPPTCDDINECATDNGGCLPLEICVNNTGSGPTCTCEEPPPLPPPPTGPCGNGVLDAGEVCDDGNEEGDDFCAADCMSYDVLCSVDHPEYWGPIVGSVGISDIEVGSVHNLVALCDGWVILPDVEGSAVDIINARTGLVVRSYALGAPPGEMDLDRNTSTLFVALEGMPFITRIDLVSHALTDIPISEPAQRITVAEDGLLFAKTGLSGVVNTLMLVDGVAGTEVKTFQTGRAGPIVYSPPLDALFDINLKSERKAFDSTLLTLTLEEGVGNGKFWAVARDGSVATTGYTGVPDGVLQVSADDFSDVWGQFPRVYATSYSPDGEFVTNGEQVFSRHTHAPVENLDGCHSTYAAASARFSEGGRAILWWEWCSSETFLTWQRFDPPPPGVQQYACKTAACGDGVIDEGEVCDDGNLMNGDLCSADCSTLDVACTYDDPNRSPDEMGASIAPRSAHFDFDGRFVPLCNGWILDSNYTSNEVGLFDTITGTYARRYQAHEWPAEMALDGDHGALYVTLGDQATRINRIDLTTGDVTDIPLPGKPLYLSVGPWDTLFVTYYRTNGGGPWIAFVDRVTQAVTVDESETVDPFVTYDPETDRVFFSGATDAWPGSAAQRYSFDSAGPSLTFEESLESPVTFSSQIAVSPDGQHLTTTLLGYKSDVETTVFLDASPLDLTDVPGAFWLAKKSASEGNYVRFSADSNLMAASAEDRDTGYTSLRVFDVETRAVIDEIELRPAACGSGTSSPARDIGFSPGGLYLYGRTSCPASFDGETDGVVWKKVLPSSPPPPPPPVCGNGVIDENETCDDGDTLDGNLCNADCTAFDFACTNDASRDLPGVGVVDTIDTYANDFVPLCDAWLLLPDLARNRVDLYNQRTGQTMRSYQLEAVPDRLAFDANEGVLYVSSYPATRVEKVRLDSGVVERIALPNALHDITLGNDGWLFGSIQVNWLGPHHTSIIDGTNTVHAATVLAEHGEVLTYDRTRDVLIGGILDIAHNPRLLRSSFDATGVSLTALQSRDVDYSLGRPVVSNDGSSLVHELSGLGVLDLDPTDVDTAFGSWVGSLPGMGPQAAAFDPASTRIAIGYRTAFCGAGCSLQVFDADSYAFQDSFDIAECGEPVLIRFSSGGRFASVLCEDDAVSPLGHLTWVDLTP